MSPRLRRLTGYLMLGVFFATFASSLSARHLEGEDDALCAVGSGTGPAAIKAQTPTPTPSPTHCAVCHWLRTVAGAASYGLAPVTPLVTAQRLDRTIVESRPRDSVFSQSSPRAPPASSLLS